MVSHSIGAVWAMCDFGMFMHKGSATEIMPIEDTIRAYEQINNQYSDDGPAIGGAMTSDARSATDVANGLSRETEDGGRQSSEFNRDKDKPLPMAKNYGHRRGGDGTVEIPEVRLLSLRGRPMLDFEFREGFILEADITVSRPLKDVLIRYTIDARHYKFICVLDSLEQSVPIPELQPGTYRARFQIDHCNLRPGGYAVNVAMVEKGAAVHIFYWFAASRFNVLPPRDFFLYADDNAIVHLDSAVSIERISADQQILSTVS
jgi:lipopolysaccharide transport system ATP-binding protein